MPFVVRSIFAALIVLPGCSENLDFVDYTPLVRADWDVSTPAEQGLDSQAVQRLYGKADQRSKVHSVLVIKNGYLVAEHYFNGSSADQPARLQSATKSFTSAFVGIALEEGCLSSIDQHMIDFFPELADRIRDPRKNEITIRHLLQMRAGYPWEESTDELFEILYGGFRASTLVDIPLVRDPGSDFDYSSLSSHIVAIIVARACKTDLRSFGEEHLFGPLGINVTDWITDWEGNYNGHGDLFMTPRDMAKFGQLYLDGGEFRGVRLITRDWVDASMQTYSPDAWDHKVGDNFTDMGYGYQWWSARAGDHRFNFAWGHGGQQITVFEEMNMVVVVTADPLWGEHGGGPWSHEKAHLNLVGDFIASL